MTYAWSAKTVDGVTSATLTAKGATNTITRDVNGTKVTTVLHLNASGNFVRADGLKMDRAEIESALGQFEGARLCSPTMGLVAVSFMNKWKEALAGKGLTMDVGGLLDGQSAGAKFVLIAAAGPTSVVFMGVGRVGTTRKVFNVGNAFRRGLEAPGINAAVLFFYLFFTHL
jgi:hypothetical protein